ncbi:MlaD family protein, partial [Streptomyces boncukensis]|nr:MCE family protein [Streptomyces boncukensis]
MNRRAARAGIALCAGVSLVGLALVPGGFPSPRFDGLEDLPLPGGADLGGHPYTVTAEFRNVVNLFPHSAVKVNDVAVGRVTKVSLGEGQWHATVTMKVNGKVELPRGAYAHLEQSSLLGEKYIQLTAPKTGKREGDGGSGGG